MGGSRIVGFGLPLICPGGEFHRRFRSKLGCKSKTSTGTAFTSMIHDYSERQIWDQLSFVKNNP